MMKWRGVKGFIPRRLWIFLLIIFVVSQQASADSEYDKEEGSEQVVDCSSEGASGSPTCSLVDDGISEEARLEAEPNLRSVPLDDGGKFYAYMRADLKSFYDNGKRSEKELARLKEKKPHHTGIAGRFTNMTPDRMILYWIPPNGRGFSSKYITIAHVEPFETSGTATFVSHVFCFAPTFNPTQCDIEFTIQPKKSRYVYNPFEHYSEIADVNRRYHSLTQLNPDQMEKYDKLVRGEDFAKLYKRFTGREYLGLHPRAPPVHFMWRADYFGQQFMVDTKETHFISLPPENELGRILEKGSQRRLHPSEPRALQSYRTTESPTLTMKLTVISCEPRVFEIQNFLSDIEVEHVLDLASTKELHLSTVHGRGDDQETRTRTSTNTWIYRETSPIVDAIYRRAADLLQINEAYIRPRSSDELPHVSSKRSSAEALQLVHYEVGQEYTAHHDFGYPPTMDKDQSTRFATLLLYLNDDFEGGQTAFPRWRNAETGNQLKVTPVKGKAVLFYSVLPDGSQDDLSQHASIPVTEGEKWLTNLWVHEPIYEK